MAASPRPSHRVPADPELMVFDETAHTAGGEGEPAARGRTDPPVGKRAAADSVRQAEAPPSELGGVSEDSLDAIAETVESGAGLPEMVRALARALDASLAVTDARGVTLAVAARSPADERSLLADGADVNVIPLRVADLSMGALRMRARKEVSEALRRLLLALVASEVQRLRSPDRAAEAAAAELLGGLLQGDPPDRERSLQYARELALEIEAGASLIVARAHPQAATEEGWRERVRVLAERGARSASSRSIAALSERENAVGVEVLLLVPGRDEAAVSRAGEAVLRELQAGLPGCTYALGRSRVVGDHAELPRAASEALLAANVAEGSADEPALAFEQTGAYRLLLSAMSENPAELRRFYEETVAPVAAYDEQYETELVRTLRTFLDADGNVAGTAQRLFTHRHTIYYRLERVRELSGLDVSSSDGREKLSLGLKAMRVLGIAASSGPASEIGGAPQPPTPGSARLARGRPAAES
jgi:PucR C-terminal helix-turn-helix domain